MQQVDQPLNRSPLVDSLLEQVVRYQDFFQHIYQYQQKMLNRQRRQGGFDPKKIQEGDLVVVRNHKPDVTTNPKLQPRYTSSYHGPWQVLQVVDRQTMMISDGKCHKQEHMEHLKKYNQPKE